MIELLQSVRAEVQRRACRRSDENCKEQRIPKDPARVAVFVFRRPMRHQFGYRQRQTVRGQRKSDIVDPESHGINSVSLNSQKICHRNSVYKAYDFCENPGAGQDHAL